MSNTEHQQPTTTTTTTTTTSPPTSIIESRDGDTTKHNEQPPSEPHPQQSPIKPTSSSSSAAVVEQQQHQQQLTTTTTTEQQEQNGFKINTTQLTKLIDPKSIKSLSDLGGPQQLSILLQTDLDRGLNNLQETLPNRTAQFGTNILPEKPTKTIFQLIWLALQDKVLIILIIAAVISLALGLYTTLGTPPKSYTDSNGNLVTEPQVDWVEGVAILVAVAIVTLVGSVNDYQKELQFKKLNAQKEDRSIKVIRQGQEQILQIGEILVGDLLLVNAGDLLPADGIFLDGYEVKCDESSVTGESDLIKKVNYNQALQLALQKSGKPSSETLKEEVQLGKTDCFMISGSKVVEGYGRYLVTAVGPNSFYGKIMISLQGDTESTPLQTKLNSLAELIAKLGATAGLILFTALMIRFFVQLKTKADR
ncbi:hypothetical protein PGTUg99_024978 [Puccinia graminis f. sp. tritici]|nr:hypothetical protein PGTUg99_024978 [Puccinia graminis f. sp. tritici]